MYVLEVAILGDLERSTIELERLFCFSVVGSSFTLLLDFRLILLFKVVLSEDLLEPIFCFPLTVALFGYMSTSGFDGESSSPRAAISNNVYYMKI